MSWDREKRGLYQRKQEKPKVKDNLPLDREGVVGDLSIRKVASGVFLFFKGIGEWFKLFNSSNHAIPDKPNTYDLGSQHLPWRGLYLSENGLHLGNTKAGKTNIYTDGVSLYFVNTSKTTTDLTASGGGGEVTLTNTAPTSASDFASTDIILQKDTGRLWWYSDTNSKLYYHSYDSSVSLTFNITVFISNDLTPNGTYFIKDGAATLDSTVDFRCTVNNPNDGTITSGTVTLSGAVNSSQTITVSNTALLGNSSPYTWDTENITGGILYPTNTHSWTSGYKKITFTLSMNDGATTSSASFYILFKNKKFYGYTTLTDPTVAGFNIYDLQSSGYITTFYTQSEVTIITSAFDNYLYYAYPSRISGTPTFKVNGFTTSFTSYTTSKTNQVTDGYNESFIIWKSPQVYNNATLTFEVI